MGLLEALALVLDAVTQRPQFGGDLVEGAGPVVDPPQFRFVVASENADQHFAPQVAGRAVQDVVGRIEHGAEELQLLAQDLEHQRLRDVALGEEVDDGHVPLLTVAVAATDALLDALRVPGQVVVHDRVAELQVQALGAGLGGDEDDRAGPELVDQRQPHRDIALPALPLAGFGLLDPAGESLLWRALPRWSRRRA